MRIFSTACNRLTLTRVWIKTETGLVCNWIRIPRNERPSRLESARPLVADNPALRMPAAWLNRGWLANLQRAELMSGLTFHVHSQPV
jgi:hypothetical protein